VYRDLEIPPHKEVVDVWGFWQKPQSAGLVEARAVAAGEAHLTI